MYVDQLLERMGAVKDSNGSTNSEKIKSTAACAIVGGLTGLMIGYSKKWNLFYSFVTGAAIAGIIGSAFVPKKKEL